MNFHDIWKTFSAEIESCDRRLTEDLDCAWKDIHALNTSQVRAFEEALAEQPGTASLHSLRQIFDVRARRLLQEPVEAYWRERPQQRALRAFSDWDGRVEDVIRTMPEAVMVSGAQWLEAVGQAGISPITRTRLKLRRKPQPVAFRRNLLEGFQLRRLRRIRTEGRIMYILAEASTEILTPWHSMLVAWLSAILQEPRRAGKPEKELRLMRERVQRYDRMATTEIAKLRLWAARNDGKIANLSPLGGKDPAAKFRLEKRTGQYLRYRDFWVRQSRAVDSDIELERKLVSTERDMIANFMKLRQTGKSRHYSVKLQAPVPDSVD
jgi:hypothetical protein